MSYNGGAVQGQVGVVSLGSGNMPGILGQNASSCIRVTANEATEVTITVSGSGRADLYVFQDQDDCNDWDDAEDSHTGNANPKVVTIHADGDGAVWFRIYNSSNNNATGSLTYAAHAPRSEENTFELESQMR